MSVLAWALQALLLLYSFTLARASTHSLLSERRDTLRQHKELYTQQKRWLSPTGYTFSRLEAANLASPLDAPRHLLSDAALSAVDRRQHAAQKRRVMQEESVSQLMPLEADEVEALIISLDRIYQHSSLNTAMWATAIASAQRQGIAVISYTCKTGLDPVVLQRIKDELDAYPGVNASKIMWVTDYEVDSIWMRDFGPMFYFMPPHVAPQNVTPASEVQSVAQVTAPGNLPQTGGDDQRHTSTSNDNSNSAASNQGRASILRRLLGLPDTLRSTTDSSTLGSHTSQDLGDPAEELVADVLQSDRESATAGSASQTTSFGNTGASTLGYTPGVLSAVYFSDRPADMVLPQEFAKRVGLGHAQVQVKFEGGNLLANGKGICIMSDRVLYVSWRGTNLTLAQRKALLHAELLPYGCEDLIVVESLTYDITGHVDMWMAWADASTLMVGLYTEKQNPLDHLLMNHNIELLRKHSHGRFDIVTVPMPSMCRVEGPQLLKDASQSGQAKEGNSRLQGPEEEDEGVDSDYGDVPEAPVCCPDQEDDQLLTRTYLNAVPLNDEVIVPVFNQDRRHEEEALRIWESVAGGRWRGRVRTVVADDMIVWSGSIHCMTRTVPKGALPPAFLTGYT